MQHKRLENYLELDAYTRQRTAIFSTVTGRPNAVIVASSGPDFTRPERIGFQLMNDNEPAPHYNFTPFRVPHYPVRATGQMSAGYRFGEVQPWWFSDNKINYDLSVGACAQARLVQNIRSAPKACHRKQCYPEHVGSCDGARRAQACCC